MQHKLRLVDFKKEIRQHSLVYFIYYEECLCITIDSGKTNMNNAMDTRCPFQFIFPFAD